MQTPDYEYEYSVSLNRAKRGVAVYQQIIKNKTELLEINPEDQDALKAQYKKFPERLMQENYEYDHIAALQPSHLACVVKYYREHDKENFPEFRPLIFSSRGPARTQIFTLEKFITNYLLTQHQVRQLDFYYEWSHVMPVSIRKEENSINVYYFEPSANTKNLSVLRQTINLLKSKTSLKFKVCGYAPDCSSIESIKQTSLQMSQYDCHSFAVIMLRKMAKKSSYELDDLFSNSELFDLNKLPAEYARYSQSATNLSIFQKRTSKTHFVAKNSSTSLSTWIKENTYLELEKDYRDVKFVYTLYKRHNPLIEKILKHFQITTQVLETAKTPEERISFLRKIREEVFVTYDERQIAF